MRPDPSPASSAVLGRRRLLQGVGGLGAVAGLGALAG